MLLLIKQVLMGKKTFMRGGHWTCSKRTRTAGGGLEWFGGLRPSAHQHERLETLKDPEIPQNASVGRSGRRVLNPNVLVITTERALVKHSAFH